MSTRTFCRKIIRACSNDVDGFAVLFARYLRRGGGEDAAHTFPSHCHRRCHLRGRDRESERWRAAGIAGVQFQLHIRCLACRRRNAINAVAAAVLPHAARELKGNDSSCGLLVGWMDRYPLLSRSARLQADPMTGARAGQVNVGGGGRGGGKFGHKAAARLLN